MKYLLVASPTAEGEPESEEEVQALDQYVTLMAASDVLLAEMQRLEVQRRAMQQPSINNRGELVFPAGANVLPRIAALR